MKKRWRRWLKRFVLGTLALVVLAIGGALIIIHTDAGRRMIARQVEGILGETFPGGVKIGLIEGSPFGELVIHDIILNGPDKQPFIAATKVTASIELRALFYKTVRVTSVVAEGLVVTNPRPPGPETPEEPGALTIELPHVEAHGAKLHLDVGPDGPLDLVDIDLVGGLDIASGMGPIGIFAAIHARDPVRGISPTVIASLSISDEIRIPFAVVEAAGAKIVIAGGATGAEFDRPAAHVIIDAPRAAIQRLSPGLAVPGDVWLTLEALTPTPGEKAAPTTGLRLTGMMGDARVRGVLAGELATLSVRGVIGAYSVDLGAFSAGGITGRGDATLTVALHEGHLKGALVASSQINAFAPAHVLAAFEGTIARVEGLALVTSAGGLYVAVTGGVTREGDGVQLLTSHLGIGIDDAFTASAGLAPVRGALALDAHVGGTLDDLAVTGKLRGTRLRMGELGIGSVRGEFAGRIGDRPSGIARLDIQGVTNAGELIGSATIDASVRPDRSIGVVASVRVVPQKITADIAANVKVGEAIDVALSSLRVTLPHGVWEGAGGHVHIDDAEIAATNIQLASGDSSLALDATVGRLTSVVKAKVVAKDIVLGTIAPSIRGTVNANIALEKRGISWKGGGTIAVRGLAAGDVTRPLDATLDLAVDGRRVKVGVKASNAEVGGVRVAVEVVGPPDITDAAAWQRVPRSDLHAITIGLDSVNARALTNERVPGIYDGTIEIREGIPDGKLRARGIPTPFGTARADVSLAFDPAGFVDITADANVGYLGDATAIARLQIAERPFAVDAWKALGINALRSATIETSPIVVDKKFLAQLGVPSPVTGVVKAKVTVGAGLSFVDAAIDATDVIGGPLREKIAIALTAHSDEVETTAAMKVSLGTLQVINLPQARIEVPLDQWLSDPKGALGTPIEAVMSVPKLDARQVLEAVGRNDITSGTLSGTIMVGGTPLAPTGTAAIDLANVAVRPRLSGKPLPVLEALKVAVIWDGKAATIAVTGKERGEKVNGSLAIQIVANPAAGTAQGSVSVNDFEIAPIAAFLPGALVGASGKLNALVKLTGLDPTAGQIKGVVELTGARMPLTAVLGTLRDGTVRVEISDKEIAAKLQGKIGQGTIEVSATADSRAERAKMTAKVVKLMPIGFLQPQIDATASGSFERDGVLWTGTLDVVDAKVFIPEARGNVLLDQDVPLDLIFIDEAGVVEDKQEKKKGRVPERPFFIADIILRGAKIDMPSFQPGVAENGFVQARGRVRLSVGESIGMEGTITVERGNVELMGRRYDIEEAGVTFDGSMDPRFDVRLMHEFPEVTTRVRVSGRPSTIGTLQPEFTSEPGTYSQSQLLGFFLGGNPSDENANRSAAVGAGGALVFAKLRNEFSKRTGFRLDVLRCEPSAGDSSTSCTAGRWLRDDLFVAGVARPGAKQGEENSGEAKLQYYFLPRLLLDFVGGSTTQGGDLLYRYRF